MILAGIPPINKFGGVSLQTQAHAATTQESPTVMLFTKTALEPIQQPLPIV